MWIPELVTSFSRGPKTDMEVGEASSYLPTVQVGGGTVRPPPGPPRLMSTLAIVALGLGIGGYLLDHETPLRVAHLFPLIGLPWFYRVQFRELFPALVVMGFVFLMLLHAAGGGELSAEPVYALGHVFLALMLYRVAAIGPRIVTVWVAFALITLSIYFLLSVYFFGQLPGDLVTGSRNNITTLLVALMAVAILTAGRIILHAYEWVYVGVSIVAASTAMVLLTGRTGVVVGGMMLVVLICLVARRRSWSTVMLLAALFVGLLVMGSSISESTTADTAMHEVGIERFREFGTDTSRRELWSSVSDAAWERGALAGLPGSQTDVLGRYNQPHNGYLSILIRYGFVGLAIAVALLLAGFGVLVRRDWVAALVFFVLLLRAFFDVSFTAPLYLTALLLVWLLGGLPMEGRRVDLDS